MNDKQRADYERCMAQGEQYSKTGDVKAFKGGLLNQMAIAHDRQLTKEND